MKKLILTVGISGSGKTSWAEEFTRNRSDWVNLNRDDVRFSLFNNGVRDWSRYKFKKSNESRVTEVIDQLAFDAVLKGKNITVSDTNLNPKIRDKWKQFAEDNEYLYEEKVFKLDWMEALKRNSQREGGISVNILWSQYLRMNDYLGRKVYKPDTSKRKAVIVDVDGTIASMQGVRKPFDWDKVSLDIPRYPIISMVQGLIEDGYEPVFLSGRDGVSKDDTYRWIEDYVVGEKFGFELFMREAGDKRKDYVVKEELFWKYVAHRWNVIAAIDDRPTIVRLWHELKIPNVIAVADPLKEF